MKMKPEASQKIQTTPYLGPLMTTEPTEQTPLADEDSEMALNAQEIAG